MSPTSTPARPQGTHRLPKLPRSCTAMLATLFVAACAPSPCEPVADRQPVVTATFVLEGMAGHSADVSVFAPASPGRFPLLVFSHGALSAPERYDTLLRTWAGYGYIVAAPLHLDSELLLHETPPSREDVWRTRQAEFIALAARPAALLDALPNGVELADAPWVAAGHSYGAFVAQVIAGARSEWEDLERPTVKPNALIALSPPGVLPTFIGDDAWTTLAVPQLLLTGTADVLPGFIDDWRAHTLAHEQASGPHQWLWVGDGVDHYFGRLIGRLDRDAEPQSAGFDSALHATRAFLRTYAGDGANDRCAPTLTPYDSDVAMLTRRQ